MERLQKYEELLKQKAWARGHNFSILRHFLKYADKHEFMNMEEMMACARAIGVHPAVSELEAVARACPAAGRPVGWINARAAAERLADAAPQEPPKHTLFGTQERPDLKPWQPPAPPPPPPATLRKPGDAAPNPFGWTRTADVAPTYEAKFLGSDPQRLMPYEAERLPTRPSTAAFEERGRPFQRPWTESSGLADSGLTAPDGTRLHASVRGWTDVVPQHSLSWEEFEELLSAKFAERGITGRAGLRRAFSKLRAAGDARITLGEFREALKRFHINPTEEELAAVAARYDTAGDGTVDLRALDPIIAPGFAGEAEPPALRSPPPPPKPEGAALRPEEVEAILARRAGERLQGRASKFSLLRLLQRWRKGGSEKEPFATHSELCAALNALGVPLSDESWTRFLAKHDPTGSGRVHLLSLCDECCRDEGRAWLEGLGENGHPAAAADVTLEAAERCIAEKVAQLSGFRALRQTVFSEPSKSGMGFVDHSELSASLRRLGLHVPPAVVRELLQKHGDGKRVRYLSFLRSVGVPGALLAPEPSTWAPWKEPAPVLPGEHGYPTPVPALVRLLRSPAPSAERRELVRRAFASQDLEHCGLLGRPQFEAALHRLNVWPTRADMDAIWRAASPDGFLAPFDAIVGAVFDDGEPQNWLDVSNELQQTYNLKEPPPPSWVPDLLEKLRARLFEVRGGSQFHVRLALRDLDPSGSGTVRARALREWLERQYFRLTDTEFAALLDRLNADETGDVSFALFARVLLEESYPGAGRHPRRAAGW